MGPVASIIIGVAAYGGGAVTTGTTAAILTGVGATTAVAGVVNLVNGDKDKIEIGFDSNNTQRFRLSSDT